MIKWFIGWLASAIALLAVAYLLPGFHVDGLQAALIASIVIGLINATIGGLIKFVTTPLRWLTLGILSLVINAAMLMVADSLLAGLTIDGFSSAFIGSILLSIIAGLLRWITGSSDDKDGKTVQ